MITEALIFKAIVTTQEFDFSFWALFARATLTVKIVILMLMLLEETNNGKKK